MSKYKKKGYNCIDNCGNKTSRPNNKCISCSQKERFKNPKNHPKFGTHHSIEDKETLVRLSITWRPFWDVNNGKTLCEDCHKKTNSYGINADAKNR